jgi:hypothetical protein
VQARFDAKRNAWYFFLAFYLARVFEGAVN